ncbi:hypothetical protein [Methylobacterium sp. Gmos1]
MRVPLVQDLMHQMEQSLGFSRVPPFSFVLHDAFDEPTNTSVRILDMPISAGEFGSFVLKFEHAVILYCEATHEK